MSFTFRDFIPQIYVSFKEGISFKQLINDCFAGISVGVIALPLALAFAIASGVSPERGIFTAIVAGFVISLLGGSRVQIGGPTGAFVVIIYAIVQQFGYEGLVCATLIGGILMILMGIFRFGILLKFIPYPVTVGFTTGIALTIFTSQLQEFFGLHIDKIPASFLSKCSVLMESACTFNFYAFVVAFPTLVVIFVLRRLYPTFPGTIVAVIGATLVTWLFGLDVETIETKFGAIPHLLPEPSLPSFSWEMVKAVFPSAITIALLGAIESLLSAVVADGMTGHKHRSNCELVAQGLGNISSIIFGGIPATGAIARTGANIRLGATTPISGIVHAITLLLLILFFAPLAGKIPLAALSAVLIVVAWNMSELPHFLEVMKGPKGDTAVLLITFLLTVFIDLTVAVQVGVLLAPLIFLKKMTDHTTIQAVQQELLEADGEPPIRDDALPANYSISPDVTLFEIQGPFFYAISDCLDSALVRLASRPRVFILRLHKTPVIDASGIRALKQFIVKCGKLKILFLMCEANKEIENLFRKTDIYQLIPRERIFKKLSEALQYEHETKNQVKT